MPAEKGKIVRLISAQPKLNNTLYKYEVYTGHEDNQAVYSIQKYEVDEPVLILETPLAGQYNTVYLKKLI